MKKKVLQYLKGEKDETDIIRSKPSIPFNHILPPPPPQPRRYDEPRYAPLTQEKKESYDHLIIPPPMPVEDFNEMNNDYNNDRMPTASEIRPNLGAPDFQAAIPNSGPNNNDMAVTNANTITPSSAQEKPKVQIKPYKFTFD